MNGIFFKWLGALSPIVACSFRIPCSAGVLGLQASLLSGFSLHCEASLLVNCVDVAAKESPSAKRTSVRSPAIKLNSTLDLIPAFLWEWLSSMHNAFLFQIFNNWLTYKTDRYPLLQSNCSNSLRIRMESTSAKSFVVSTFVVNVTFYATDCKSKRPFTIHQIWVSGPPYSDNLKRNELKER